MKVSRFAKTALLFLAIFLTQTDKLLACTPSVSIDAGGAAAGSFVGDKDFSGGAAASPTTAAIDTSLLPSPVPPQAVLQSQRLGDSTYTIGGFTPGSTHTVTLYFAEIYWTTVGKRKFNVTINSKEVLTLFDIFQTAGVKNKAVQENFTTTANSSGNIVIAFSDCNPSGADQPAVSGIVIDQADGTSPTNADAIDSGGAAAGNFVADTDFAGGAAASPTTAAIDTSLLPSPVPPQAVLQSQRLGDSTYTIGGFTPGSTHTVTLYFAEIYWTAAGKRKFNVTINSKEVLTLFDIFQTAGAKNKAVEETFTTVANSSGNIVIAFSDCNPSGVDQPAVSGIVIDQTAVQSAQTINFAAISPVTYGVAPITLSATSTSGLPVIFGVVSGPGIISGNTLTITGAGTVVIAANQAGNANYAAAATVDQSLVVNKAALTITASSLAVAYGGAVPAITPSYSGWVNGQSSSSLTTPPTCTTAYTVTSAVGSLPATGCSGAVDANYAISYVAGAVTVSQAALTITASSPTVIYGDAVPAITPSYSGFTNGQSSSSLTTQPICVTAYTTTSAVGSSPATSCSGAVDANYAISYVAGAVTVSQAALTITASNPTVAYGGAVPVITPIYSGFINGQSSSSLTTQPTCTTAYTTTSAVGSSPATSCSGAVDANYAISYVAGAVTVSQAAQTITFTAPASPVTYGVAPIMLSATGGASGNPIVFSIVSGPGSISGNTLTITGAGTIVVAANQAGNTDYAAAAQVTQGVVVNQAVSVSVSPSTATLYIGQTQQFTAVVTGANVQTVLWTISPATSAGTINATGLYTSPATISAQQTATVTAASLADPTKSASATITLLPTLCGSNGYSYQRAIVINHTKVPNTDQTNFPFLFNTTDPLLATIANGGHVANPNGYDIIFTSDSAGQNVLNYEMEEYDSAVGQITAWVRIPTLSHTTDTVIYVFYGNSSITASQQSPTGVWDSNYGGVWHLGGSGAVQSFADSTANANTATVVGAVAETTGPIGNGAALSGSPNYIDAGDNPSELPTHMGTFSVWVKYNAFASWTTPMGNGNVGNDTNGAMFWHRSSGEFDFEIAGMGGLNRVTAGTLSTGEWYYLTGAWDGSTVSLYENGVLVASRAQTTDANPAYHLTLGVDGALSGSGDYLNGSLDEARVSDIARSADWIASEYSNQSSPSTFYALYPENTAAVFPATANLYASQSQQFTTTGACGAAIGWAMLGTQGRLTANGLYTAPSSIATQQTVEITTSMSGTGEVTGTSIVTLLPAPLNPALVLSAAAQPPYVVGTAQTFSTTLKNQSGTPIAGEVVTFAVTGVNINSGSAITDANGVATYTYSGANIGTDIVQATASVSGEQPVSNTVSAFWIVPVQVVSATTVTGEFFISDGSGVFDILPSATPAFVQEFPVINFNPPAGTIPGNTSGVNENTRPFTDVTTDLNGNFTGTIVAQGNGYQAGVGAMYAYQAVFKGTLTVASAGNVVFDFFSDDGFILGIANGATRVSGASINMPPETPFEQFPVMGAVNGPNGADGNQVVVNFPAAGNYPYELDYTECCGGQLSMTMTTSTASVGGVPPTGSLVISPNTVEALPAGGEQAFTVLASDASGAPVPNVSVGFVVAGVDNLQLSGTTDSTGHATVLYQDVNPGTASVQAIAFISGMVAYSNMVSVPWTLPGSGTTTTGGSGTISIGITADSTVTLPNTLQLVGTVTDSANLATTLAWTATGPGTVTFDSPAAATTNATFSQAGNYVVELTATDTTPNSGSLQFPVTVEPLPGTVQGWVGSPANGSTVSGVVPITLAPGVTIQPGGVLTYYPANNPGNITSLPITGTSGTISALDTTTLANGTYWIQLQATNVSGDQQYSLVMVSVAGSNKPGRVTATVTDLVVPATGLSIDIQRSYDSLNAGTSGDFGYGWNLGINTNLSVDNLGNVTFTLNGQRKTFYLTPTQAWPFPWYWPAYTPEPGLNGTLMETSGGCPALDFLIPDGSMWDCIEAGQFNPPGYTYTDPNGTSYTMTAAGALQSINDRSGNGLTIGPNGITSTTGLSVPFVRDPNNNNRITQITDPKGNIYQYGYDANGNLATVTYPVLAQSTSACPGTTASGTSTYTYDPTYIHLYAGGTDGRGCPLPVSSYYNSSDSDANGLPLSGRLQSVTDAFGNTTSYAYNLSTTSEINGVSVPNTSVTTITYPKDANGNVGTASMIYDSYGDLLSSTDPLLHTTLNTYDANRNLKSVTDPLGHTTSYTYDTNGNKTSSTYPTTATSQNTTSYTFYNQYSEPTSTKDELGNVRTFNYDGNYNPQSVTDSQGALASFLFNANATLQAGAIGYDISANPAMDSQFTYDANGNMNSRTDALGRTTTYVYNSLGQKTQMVTPTPAKPVGDSSSTTTYQYDALGNLIQTAAPLGRATNSTYDANGNKLSDVDARGYKTGYIYDSLNRLVETDYPDGTKSTKSYDFRNNVIDEVDQAGNDTHHVYDLAGRQTSITRGYGAANASVTSYAYDAAGRKVTETDALNHTTTYTYDADGRLTNVAGPLGNMSYAYDDAGNQIARTDGNNNTTQFQYDARKRLTKTIYPDQSSTTNIYDGPGNLASVVDQNGNEVDYHYDAANQLQTVVQVNHPEPSHNTNLYQYDNLGDLTGLTDENLHTTLNAYDQLTEPTAKTLPDGQLTETRQYDTAGNLQSLTHFNSVTTTYTYDQLNRLLSRTTPGESPVSFTYTATGKYLTSTAGDGTVHYYYDALDHLTQKVTPEGTLNYTYYSTGKVETIQSSNANGVSVSYSYDGLNRLSTVVDNRLSGNNTTAYSYDDASNVATVTYPNGLKSTFTYDTQNRLTELSTPSIADYKYTLGLTGNRTGATEQSGRTLAWNYDNIDRLNSETIAGDPSNNNGSAGYTLDPVGNRSSAVSTLEPVLSGNWTYNSDDQISSESYDADGNTTKTANNNSYTYDAENHMISMTNGTTAITMIYDAFGNRVAKTVNGVTTQYLVEDDVNPTGLPQVVEELVNNAVTRQYTYGLQRISERQQIANVWTPSFYGYDGFGTVRQLTNSAGEVTDSYEYDAFGNSFTKTGSTPNNYLYRGEQYDQDLGLYYLRARYYNPATGRFLSRDPFDGYLDDPATLHKYLYVGGDPVNWIDPTGLDEFMDIGAIDLEVSTGEDAELAAIEKRIACILQTASDALEVAIAPTGETVGSLVLDFAQCAVKAGYKENPNRQLSFGKYKNGKFKEVGRIDIGRIGAPGEGASTHMHIGGSGTHLPITTAFPW